jgi:hypothetical protein
LAENILVHEGEHQIQDTPTYIHRKRSLQALKYNYVYYLK